MAKASRSEAKARPRHLQGDLEDLCRAADQLIAYEEVGDPTYFGVSLAVVKLLGSLGLSRAIEGLKATRDVRFRRKMVEILAVVGHRDPDATALALLEVLDREDDPEALALILVAVGRLLERAGTETPAGPSS
jgi:hypothetical protein